MTELIKSTAALAAMRRAGQILAKTQATLISALKPGVTGTELDRLAEKTIASLGGQPSFKGFEGFPASVCLSVNDGLVHGIPNDRPFREGDLVGIDLGVCIDGWHVDAATTVGVGTIDPADQALVDTAWAAFRVGFAKARDGVHLGDVQHAIQTVIEAGGYGLVRNLSGHGIGQTLHEEPSIPNFGTPGQGLVLHTGMTICLEPMLTRGSAEIVTDADGWTIVTADGSRAAHVEHTILVTDTGAEILTDSDRGHTR
ncbi:type I methionyl aminopeptidase [Candidatus Berkelbacteria bacterium]|nr:type I methionyl aminopeptidase [Candidatus Berkelbacteria bacterium]